MDYSKKEKESFKNILWGTLKSLREKAANDFRAPVKKLVIHSNWQESFIEQDSRKEFCQLVEFLADIFVQELGTDAFKEYEKIFKECKEKRDEVNEEKISDEVYIQFKVDKMRELLRIIMKALKERDYLKELTFGEEYEEIEES